MKLLRNCVASALALVAVSGVAPEAHSDTLPAIGGHAYLNQDAACFQQTGFASVANTCNTGRGFNISIPNRFGDSGRSFYATTIGTSPLCFAIAVNHNEALTWQGANKTVTSDTFLGKINKTLQLATYTVACTIPSAGILSSVRVD